MTESEFKQFKRFQKIAEDNNQEVFKFKDKPFLTQYAKYLIEYWENKT